MNLGSEGVYLHEGFGMNPSRYLLGPKPPIRKTNNADFRVSGSSGEYPPAPRCGDSDHGIYVGEWMVPRCYRIDGSEKGVLVTKKTR